MIKRGLNILIHPATLSLFIGFAIILLLPPVFNKYQARIKETKKIHEPEIFSYYDLDSDGFSEEILYHGPPNNYPSFIVKNKGKIIDQWNFNGDFISGDFFIYCDYNSDSIAEIFVLTIKNDSIILTGVNPYKVGETYFIKLFIDKCSMYDGRYDCHAHFCDSPDTDENGYKELVFGINAGRSKQPRNLYLVDIFNDTVIKSPVSGTAIHLPVAFDINNDGYNEYMGKSCAFGNFHRDSIDYPDTHAWLLILDRKMNFLFEPQKFGQYKTTIDVKPFRPFKTNYLIVLQKHKGTENIDNKLILFDSNGNEIKERILEDFSVIKNSFLMSRDKVRCNDLYLFLNNGQIEQIDSNLNIVSNISLPDIQNVRPFRIDADLDGLDEFVFTTQDKQGLIITRNDFTFPVKLEFTNDMNVGPYFSIKRQGYEKPKLYTQIGSKSFIIEYSKNPLHPLKYFIWIGIYVGIFIFLFLLQKVQQIRAKQKYETEKKIAELQLKYVKTQTDPHFTLNILNSIGTLFYQNDPDKANYIFGKYAQMLKNTILRSDDISISLSEEIEYIENFLELEKFRLNNKFDYKIEIAENVNQENKVPKMLLHTFVENAIKHGIRHLETKGKLNISLEASKKNYIFTITDNGVGRVKSKEYSKFSTGKGLKILDKILGLYLNLEGVKIKYDIVDLYDNFGDPAGTKVVINVPVKINVSPG
jgi:hypothetical protein